jgi:rfaE bifunctional protein nucleotidyltransferase chain/domain
MNTSEFLQSKIFYFDKPDHRVDFSRKLSYWNFCENSLVFTNGCFDILHLGHVDYLSRAADMGNVLIVGLNSDESIHRIKGESRPILDQKSRSMTLASFSFITAVIVFDEDTPYELIKMIQPDVLVKGGDYKPDEIVGADVVLARGGRIRTIPLVDGYSTTAIENKIIGSRETGDGSRELGI